jgi:hypothetical protein
LNLSDNDDVGYTLKVDLDYPKELHDKHNDYPFFAIHKQIKYNDLSPYYFLSIIIVLPIFKIIIIIP